MTTFVKIFNERIFGLAKGVDHTIDGWFLMSSPLPVASIVAVYLLFVLKIGPNLMRDRKPYDLKKVMVLYNAFQVCFSLWLCQISIKESNVLDSVFSKKCEITRTREKALTLYSGAWWYFFSKIIDLLDTTFFVLRKKQSQVSFLHVYHHSVTALFSWGYLKYAPGEQGVIIGILNCGVHVVMYFYYMVAAMGPQYQKYLWWKKYITTIQLVQFVLILSYMILVTVKGCNMSRTLNYFFVANTIIFLYLFGNFYRNTYNSRGKSNSSMLAQAALNAAGSMGCQSKSILAQGDHLKRMIDANNNLMKDMKAE